MSASFSGFLWQNKHRFGSGIFCDVCLSSAVICVIFWFFNACFGWRHGVVVNYVGLTNKVSRHRAQ